VRAPTSRQGAQPDLDDLFDSLKSLLVASRLWARRQPLDEGAIDRAFDATVIALHARYVSTIPVYRQFAIRRGLELVPDAATIGCDLMMTSDLFKSYDPGWLRASDFESMTAWLGTISTSGPTIDAEHVTDVADWRARLRANGIFLASSSGTSGRPSFVARDHATLTALRRNGEVYARLPLDDVAPGSLDLLALTPRGMALGIQAAARGLADQAARVHRRDDAAADDGWTGAVEFLDAATGAGRPVMIFGTPPLVRELCVRVSGTPPTLPRGSLVVTGGGWKAGQSLQLDALLELVTSRLGVPPSHIVDTYGTTELNAYLLRCAHGSYHVPPLLRALVVDDLLVPVEGDDVTGLLGFLDPFAFSYPGFVIPGDVARLVRRACRCGLTGPAILGPIERSPDDGARGCATSAVVGGAI
jgi:hypothetical protein